MNYQKLSNVMRNFDEVYLDDLLGDLKDVLIEWRIGESSLVLKQNKIDIVLAKYGLSLFEDNKFRQNFFLAIDLKTVNICMSKIGVKTMMKHEEAAKKLSQVRFSECDLYKYVFKFLDIEGYVFPDKKKEDNIETLSVVGSKFYELYDYQYMIKQQVINDIEDSTHDLDKILIKMPTGTGKTKTTMHIISHYINFLSKNNGLVVWIAHSDELLKQAYDTFKSVWSHLGHFSINVYKGWAGYPETFENGILFTSIQSLLAKMEKDVFSFIDQHSSLIIFDEVHKVGAEKYSECIKRLTEREYGYHKKFIGLTATPGRTTEYSRNNSDFRREFNRIVEIEPDKVIRISHTENESNNYNGSKEVIPYLQDRGVLSKIKRELLDFSVDAGIKASIKKELRAKREEFSDELLEKISKNKARNKKIIEKLKYLNENNIPTIVFACSIVHAQMISAFLKLIDIENSLVYGDLDKFTRAKAISDFKDGKVNIIINYDILTTGFDSTNIKCVFITRPTKSVILYSQMIGRGLRGPRMGGNKECLLIDVQENLSSYNENSAFKHFDAYWKNI